MHSRFFAILTCTVALFGSSCGNCCDAPVTVSAEEEKPAAPASDKAGGDWSMFGGMPSRNMVNLTEKNVLTDWSLKNDKKKIPEKNIKWVAEHGKRGYLPPAVAAGKVFLATNNERPRDPKVTDPKGVLMCFEEATGKFLWQILCDMPPKEVVTLAEEDGMLTTPTIDGDRLYFVGPAAEVVCANLDGKVLWRYDAMKELKVQPCYVSYCSPLVVGKHVFVLTGNGRIGGDVAKPVPEPKAPSFLALEKDTGKLAWSDNSPGANLMEGQWGSPAYAEIKGKPQVIFPGGDGILYAFEPDTGKLIWKFDGNPKKAVFRTDSKGTRNYLFFPAVHDGKVYTSMGQNTENGPGVSHFWCIDASKTGDLSPEWTDEKNKEGEPTWKPKPGTGGYVWHYGGASDGGDRDYLIGQSISTPAIHDGLVYIAEREGFLHCLDAATGKQHWEVDLKADCWASPMCVDGKVYIPDGQGYVQSPTVRVMSTSTSKARRRNFSRSWRWTRASRCPLSWPTARFT
jgi:outer membrane protein assembly factor BamB